MNEFQNSLWTKQKKFVLPLLAAFCNCFGLICTSEAQQFSGDDMAGGSDAVAAEVAISPEDIDSLVDNLSGGFPALTQVRIFSGGQILEQYPESITVVQPATAIFNPRSVSLTVQGTANGYPVLEDIRFVTFEGTFFVLRDIYLSGGPADVAVGRATPQDLRTKGLEHLTTRSQSGSLRSSVLVQKTPVPTISAIHGLTDVANTGIKDGLPDMTCGSNYDYGRVVNGTAGSQFPLSMPFYWEVYGTNFGSIKGTIQLAGLTISASAISVWTPTYIKVFPTVPYNWGAMSTTFSISNSSGGKVTNALSIVPSISGRIFGQCTWFVAFTRLNALKAPSPAYPEGGGWNLLTGTYVPQLWDELAWEWTDSRGAHKHTAIITSVGTPSKTGNTTTWVVTIGEANAACNNQISYRTSSYQTQIINGKPSILRAIQTSAVGQGTAWFYH